MDEGLLHGNTSVFCSAWCVVRVRRGGQCGQCGQCGQDKNIPLPHPTTVRIITTGTVALLFKSAPPAPVPNALRTPHYAPHSPKPALRHYSAWNFFATFQEMLLTNVFFIIIVKQNKAY